jgi:hypothetical protein
MSENLHMLFGRISTLAVSLVLALSATTATCLARYSRHHTGEPATRTDESRRQDRGGNPMIFGAAIDRMILTCGEQAAELRKLPLEAVTQAIRLGDDRRDALAQVRSAANEVAKTLDEGCPKRIPGMLSAKIDALDAALKLVGDALNGLRPALATFYELLDDEQKGQLVAMNFSPDRPSRSDRVRARKAVAPDVAGQTEPKSICAEWAANLRSWPVRRIELGMQLSDEQHATFYELTAAIYRSVTDLAQACPVEDRVTPLGRLDATQDELHALREDIEAIRPFAASFENALNEAQRKQFAEVVDASTGSAQTAEAAVLQTITRRTFLYSKKGCERQSKRFW